MNHKALKAEPHHRVTKARRTAVARRIQLNQRALEVECLRQTMRSGVLGFYKVISGWTTDPLADLVLAIPQSNAKSLNVD